MMWLYNVILIFYVYKFMYNGIFRIVLMFFKKYGYLYNGWIDKLDSKLFEK